ncbi:MAG: ABC transporter permease [Cellulosilyticaceae bacterium]
MKKTIPILILLSLSIVSIFIGVSDITLIDVLNLDMEKIHIVLISRIPRLMSVILTGFGMSICGLIMQQISMNKFVSPTTGATLDSAKLGLLLSMIVVPTASIFMKTLFAFTFSLLGTFMFMGILKKIKAKGSVYIPLVGLMFGNLIGAFTSFLSYSFNLGQTANAWLYGKFSLVVSGSYELIYLVIPFIIIAFIYAKKFTLAGLGEDFSSNLGLNYKRVVNIGLVIVALVSAIIVLISGSIPFIGLIVPNIVAIYKGDHLEKNIFMTGIVGAIFLLVCDIFGRIMIFPYEIPIGLTVGILGSAIFLGLLIRRRKYEG